MATSFPVSVMLMAPLRVFAQSARSRRSPGRPLTVTRVASWVPSSTITADDCGSTCSAVHLTGWLSARNREFRAEELIRTERDRIVIVDPVQLGREQGWNQSP